MHDVRTVRSSLLVFNQFEVLLIFFERGYNFAPLLSWRLRIRSFSPTRRSLPLGRVLLHRVTPSRVFHLPPVVPLRDASTVI